MALWDTIKERLNASTPAELQRLFSLLAPELGFRNVEELAALEPQAFAELMTGVIPDMPFTDADDRLRLSAATRLIAYARSQAGAPPQGPDEGSAEGPFPPPPTADATRLGRSVARARGALAAAGVATARSLRDAARDPEWLDSLGLDKGTTIEIAAFGALSRLFPAEIAAALQQAGATGAESVAAWTEEAFATALRAQGIGARAMAAQLPRFRALAARAARGEDVAALSGIALDLGGALPADAAALLRREGIETLTDWAARRSTVTGVAKGTATRLDGHARLSRIGLTGQAAEAAQRLGASSALDIARMSAAGTAELARSAGMNEADIQHVAERAREAAGAAAAAIDSILVTGTLATTEIWTEILNGGLTEATCLACAPENSAFSCFAYYVYLVQRTGKPLDMLQSDLGLAALRTRLRGLAEAAGETPPDLDALLDLKTLSPVSAALTVVDPEEACARITLCDLLARLLQEHLDTLWAEAATEGAREQVRWLPFEVWRAERMAHYFPELEAHWRDTVLIGREPVEERGSILQDRAAERDRIVAQLELAESALDAAKITHTPGPVSDTEFDGLTDFSDEPYHGEFLEGLALVRDIVAIDDTVQGATAALDSATPGLALSELSNALVALDDIAARVFPRDSVWRSDDRPPLDALARLAARSPADRKARLQALYDDLLDGPKAIYQPASGDEIVIDGLRDNGTIDLDHNAWTVSSGVTETGSGFSVAHQGTDGGRIIRYTRGYGLEDYSVRFDFERSEDSSSYFAPTGKGGIAIRLREQVGGGGYYVLFIETRYKSDGEISGNEFWLVMEKVQAPDTRVKLGEAFIGYTARVDTEARGIVAGPEYHMRFEANGPILFGKVVVPGRGTIDVSAEDDTFDTGTFAIRAHRWLDASFRDIRVEIDTRSGYPPFYSSNRRRAPGLEIKMYLDDEGYYWHSAHGQGMSRRLRLVDPVRVADDTVKVELHGARRLDRQLHLVFKAGALKVDPFYLDRLLDRALASLFYLKFAVIPTRLAQAWFLSGEYAKAAEILRLLYDDTAPGGEEARIMYPAFAAPPDLLDRAIGPDVRLVRLRLGDIYLAWAEWLFRRDDPASRHQARRLYRRVLALHDIDDDCACEARLGNVLTEIVDRWSVFVPAKPHEEPGLLDDPSRYGDLFDDLADAIDGVVGIDDLIREIPKDPGNVDPPPETFDAVIGTFTDAFYRQKERRTVAADRFVRVNGLFSRGDALLREAEMYTSARAEPDPVAAALRADTRRARMGGRAMAMYAGGRWGRDEGGPSGLIEWQYGVFQYPAFCVPPNPMKASQAKTACLMLDLLAACRNVLGFGTDSVPPLRFEALLRSARGFADQAHAAERDLHAFRQSFEQETFSLLQAESNLAISEGEVGIETLGIEEARSGLRLADLQLRQVSHALDHYETLLAEGLSDMEKLALGAAWTSAAFGVASAAGTSAATLIGLGVTAAGVAQMGTGVLAGPGAVTSAAGIASTVASSLGSLGQMAGAASQAAGAISSAASLQASFERRTQDWEFQRTQTAFAQMAAQEALVQAGTRFEIAQRRRALAMLKRDSAADAMQFLSHKFLNGAMWVWLQRVIREQYRTRLNYAISAAFMAERALAFEIQNPAFRSIRFDYFDPQRDGLLGATQLQTDLSSLEYTRLSVTQRKLQLTRTISLAQEAPVEFEMFRSGATLADGTTVVPGRIRFNTPAALFDRDFPGHYMRLIRNVRVTLLALVPPIEGIRASLRNPGVSRVVVGPPFGGDFAERTIRRDPEAVALSSPYQASGVYAIDPTDTALLPFEGSGVDTGWVLELPPAANRFDYRSIVDVLVTVDYTALENATLAARKIEQMGTAAAAARPFSLRWYFVDEWYQLNNPVPPGADTLSATLDIARAHFPPNLRDLQIASVALYVVRKAGAAFELPITGLTFSPAGGGATVGGAATTIGGVVSQHAGNAGNWAGFVDRAPFGTWRLDLPNTDAAPTLARLRSGEIEDVLLLIDYRAESPPWQ